MNDALLQTVEWEVQVGFVVSILFPVITRFYWPWNQSWWGWNTILLELSIAGVLFPSWMELNFRFDDVWLQWMEAASLGAVIVNVLWRVVMIWYTQRRGVLRDQPEDSSSNLGSEAR